MENDHLIKKADEAGQKVRELLQRLNMALEYGPPSISTENSDEPTEPETKMNGHA